MTKRLEDAERRIRIGHGHIQTHTTFLGLFRIQCGCGWISQPLLTANMAEQSHDNHSRGGIPHSGGPPIPRPAFEEVEQAGSRAVNNPTVHTQSSLRRYVEERDQLAAEARRRDLQRKITVTMLSAEWERAESIGDRDVTDILNVALAALVNLVDA